MAAYRLATGWLLAWMVCAAGANPVEKVLRVQPSGPEVPANLLRVSVTFDQPVAGEVQSRLALRLADGRTLDSPFLPQELWSPDGTVLTLLLHPGRVKTGLVAHEELGPILVANEGIVLTLDDRPIKRWRVGPADTEGPVAIRWQLSHVRTSTRQPLAVTLDGPIEGRAVDFLAVADGTGQRVEGQAYLAAGEGTWMFVPAMPWRAGTYRLRVRDTLEDAAGNRLGRQFEAADLSTQARVNEPGIEFSVTAPGPS
ncbi:MAG TPA: hypothetical protein VGC74_09520 [Stenotrophomonas sp.]|jgi:hypothetical protein